MILSVHKRQRQIFFSTYTLDHVRWNLSILLLYITIFFSKLKKYFFIKIKSLLINISFTIHNNNPKQKNGFQNNVNYLDYQKIVR